MVSRMDTIYAEGVGVLRLPVVDKTTSIPTKLYPIKINFDVELDDVELRCLFIQAKGLRDGHKRRKREIELGL